jgi:hypothetical protein
MRQSSQESPQLLDLTPTGRYADGSPMYSFHTSFPSRGVRTEGGQWSDAEQAYEAGVRFVREYERRDPFGNMGEVLGVTEVSPEHFAAVVNTYHSNT